MVQVDWSTSRQIPSEIQLKIEPKLYVSARQMLNSGRQIFVLIKGEQFVLASSEMLHMDRRAIKESAHSLDSLVFDSFEEFSETRFKVGSFKIFPKRFQVHVIRKIGGSFTCTCPVSSKKHVCKHIIFVGCKLGDFTYPPDALAQPLSQKPKRGRPRKAQTQSSSRN